MAYPQQFYPYTQQQYFTPNAGAAVDVLNQYKYGMMQPQMPQMPAMQPANEMIWVLGEVEATSYPVAPNNTVTLWDKNTPTIYIKSVNAQGVPSMRILDFTERTQGAQNTPIEHHCGCEGKYAPINEFNALRESIEALRREFEEHKKGGVNDEHAE